jgi:hypothetical protein
MADPLLVIYTEGVRDTPAPPQGWGSADCGCRFPLMGDEASPFARRDRLALLSLSWELRRVTTVAVR